MKNGADLEVHDCHYGTPLFITCFKHHYECAKYLLNCGVFQLANLF